MATLGDLIVRIGGDISGFVSSLKSVVDATDDAADQIESRLESIGNVGGRLVTVGAELTAAITLPIEEMGRRALETAAQFEQVQVAFTTFLGSTQNAREMLAGLYQFAATTPFEVPGVLQAGRTLLAMGFSAKDVPNVLRTLGDAASGLGVGQAGLERFVFHLGQIRALGHIDGMILREMGQNGIAASQMIADAMGKSVPEIAKMVRAKDPSLSADTVINALLEGMNNQFGGAMKDQMTTLSGMWSNLKDQITLTMVDIGNVLIPAAKMFVDFGANVLNAIKDLAHWFADLPAPVQAGIGALLAMAAATGPLLAGLGGIGLMLPGIVAVVSPLAGALGISVIALGGWAVGIAIALAALAALGVWVESHWAGVKAVVANAFEGVQDVWESTIAVPVTAVVNLFEWVLAKTAPVWNAIGTALKGSWDAIKTDALEFWNTLKGIFQAIFEVAEKIPGIQKLLNTGKVFNDADSKAQSDRADKKAVEEAESTLHMGSHAFKITSQETAWDEKHQEQIKQYTAAVAKLREEHDRGKVSAEEVAEAERKLQALINTKRPKFGAPEKPGKLDRNAIDGLSGAHAHEESLLAQERAKIEHEFHMSQAGTAARSGGSAEDQAKTDIAAAEKRKAELDATYELERKQTLANLASKLALYRSDQAGHQKLIEAKQAAEDKYAAQIQKTTFDVEMVKKQSADRILAEQDKQAKEDIKAQKQQYEMALKTVDLMVQGTERELQQKIKLHEFDAQMADKRLQFELETGEISKAQYLRLKQEQYNVAFAMEMDAIAKERAEIEKAFAELREEAVTDAQKRQVEADYKKRIQPLNERQQTVQMKQSERTQDTQIGLGKDQFTRMGKVFGPFQSNFASAITSMVEGTKTFKQAWSGMVTGMLGQWIQSLAQMASRWITHKLMELALHVTTNQAKVASDASAAAESNSISLGMHLKQIMMAAKLAAAKAWSAVVGIPIVGPVLAPIAAAATFAGIMAFGAISAESGAVLPNHDTVGFLHPQEMVLPRGISVGLQNLIASGGLNNASGVMNQGASMGSTALQMMRNTAAAAGDTNHTHHWGGITIHNSAKDPITEDRVFSLMQGALRRRNLQMA